MAVQERLGLAAGKSILKQTRYGPPAVGYRFEEPPDEDEDVLDATLDSEVASYRYDQQELIEHCTINPEMFAKTLHCIEG